MASHAVFILFAYFQPSAATRLAGCTALLAAASPQGEQSPPLTIDAAATRRSTLASVQHEAQQEGQRVLR